MGLLVRHLLGNTSRQQVKLLGRGVQEYERQMPKLQKDIEARLQQLR